jgi:hypothetical protein
LEGGWARYVDPETGVTIETRSPSCYQCHGEIWNTRYPEFIEVYQPTSDVVWRHGSSRVIEWWGPRTDSAAVYLTDDFLVVDTLKAMGPTNGIVRLDSVETAWGTGELYRVYIAQSSGGDRLGQAFSICEAGGGVIVTKPSQGEIVLQGETLRVEWRCAAGTTVDIFIHDGDERLDSFRLDAGNGGYAERVFPASWGTGTNYRIQVVDAEGVMGFSATFEIREAVAPESAER